VGNSLGNFFGGLSVATDEDYSLATRKQAAYDVGENVLAPVEGAALIVGPKSLGAASRIEALGTDPSRGFIRSEGVGGLRIEQDLGRTITRSADVAADFVDRELGPISLKGPIPQTGSVEGLANKAIWDANFNTFTNAVFVDLGGLSNVQREAVRSTVKAGTANVSKPIYFLD